MKDLIIALVTASAAVIGVVLVEILFGRRTYGLLEKHGDRTEVIKEHLSKEHSSLSKEHVLIMERVANILSGVNNINTVVIEEKQSQSLRYDSLTDKQKDLKMQLQSIELLARDWERQSLEIKTMAKDLSELKELNEKLMEENYELKEQLRKIKNKNRGYER
jgi:DNA repair exonuclease SbcCD ATPase subunit